MFSSTIPNSTITLVNETLTITQRATMPLRFLVFHLIVAMVSMKRVVLHLKTELKVNEAHESDKSSVKVIVTKFNSGKTRMYDMLQAKLEIRNPWKKCSNGLFK
jgi:hypothetical protein